MHLRTVIWAQRDKPQSRKTVRTAHLSVIMNTIRYITASCSCIRFLEFSAVGHLDITFLNRFPPPAEDISLSQIIP